MDVHQSGTLEDRRLYASAFSNPAAWRALDTRNRFDFVVHDGRPELVPGDRLLDQLDADPAWALVFRDDAATVYVRREGYVGALAESLAYRFVPAGGARLPALMDAYRGDPRVHEATRNEVARMLQEPHNARAHSLAATLAWIDGDRVAARAHLDAALAIDPETPAVRQRLGLLHMAEGRPAEAVREFLLESASGFAAGDGVRLGQAYQALGDARRARVWYRRELKHNPGNAEARDSLQRLDAPARR